MIRDGDRSKLFTRRTAMLAGGKVFLASALVGRMYYLQVIEADKYIMKANDNRISLRMLPPPRGVITDRHGTPLAVNKQNFRALIVSEKTENLDLSIAAISKIIPLSKRDIRRIKKDTKRKKNFVPVTVKKNLSWEDMVRIQVNAPDLPGVIIDEGLSRFYPYDEIGAHVLGYVASVSENDLTGDPLLELPGARIGKAGIEKIYDLALRGKGGSKRVEVNALGRVIREIERKEGEPGTELRLSLDVDLQKFTEERMKDQSGTVVVMDVHTGDVLTMASTPAFNPNSFNRGLSSKEWNALNNNIDHPLINKAITGRYSPGSTFKMVVALAALESGVISPEQKIYCNGYIELGNRRFHCWKKQGHGPVNMIEAIQHSCDIYFYEVAKRLGINRIAKMARMFGLGQISGIDLPGEYYGLIPDREWKEYNIGEPWQVGDTYNAGIGQGFVSVTPLQLAIMTSRIANGGIAVSPKISHLPSAEEKENKKEENKEEKKPNFPKMDISRKNLQIIRDAMFAVVNIPGGTAYGSRFDYHGADMCGKTGTTQVRRITMKERESEEGVRKQEDLERRLRNHAMFVGFAPSDSPKYAVSVLVEHGGSGSRAAAPVARDVLREIIRLEETRKKA